MAPLGTNAEHINDETYPYAAEVTLVLHAQEKFYRVDPANQRLFHEATASRLADYKFWGSGIVATQNDPDDDSGPHGPARKIGLLVHEMGENREGVSTLELIDIDGEPGVRLIQHTVLVHRNGDRHPDVDIEVELPMELTQHRHSSRVTTRLTQTGAKRFEQAVSGMLATALTTRRSEIDQSLASNGLRIVPGTEYFAAHILRHARMRLVFDGELGAARVRLPDMRFVMGARLEQVYSDPAADGN
ncbi:MAG: hypothetical protein GKR94_22300 [Gammaproteobacteria bacterium]|nr:hypothetical protein [Gammaproteobacteria bacterium]